VQEPALDASGWDLILGTLIFNGESAGYAYVLNDLDVDLGDFSFN
jgi:hypothetical protein